MTPFVINIENPSLLTRGESPGVFVWNVDSLDRSWSQLRANTGRSRGWAGADPYTSATSVFAEGFMGFRLSVRFDPGCSDRAWGFRPHRHAHESQSLSQTRTSSVNGRNGSPVTVHYLSSCQNTSSPEDSLSSALKSQRPIRRLMHKSHFYHPNRRTHLSGIHVVQHDDRRAVIVQNQSPKILHCVRQRMLGNDERRRLLVALSDWQKQGKSPWFFL